MIKPIKFEQICPGISVYLCSFQEENRNTSIYITESDQPFTLKTSPLSDDSGKMVFEKPANTLINTNKRASNDKMFTFKVSTGKTLQHVLTDSTLVNLYETNLFQNSYFTISEKKTGNFFSTFHFSEHN